MSNPTTKSQFIAALTDAGVAIPRKAKLEVLQDLFAKLPVEPTLPTSVDQMALDRGATPEAPKVDDFVMSDAELEAQRAAGTRPVADPRDGDCPGCGIHLSNGLLTPDDEAANEGGATLHQMGMLHHEFECMGCGHMWGDVRPPYVAPTPAATGTGLRIEKDRPEANGVKRPSIGGKCRAIWDALDAHAEATGDDPTSKDVKALAATHGWNPNNASIEFYQWRKFNGITKPKA
jgi:hypothetical protein